MAQLDSRSRVEYRQDKLLPARSTLSVTMLAGHVQQLLATLRNTRSSEVCIATLSVGSRVLCGVLSFSASFGYFGPVLIGELNQFQHCSTAAIALHSEPRDDERALCKDPIHDQNLQVLFHQVLLIDANSIQPYELIHGFELLAQRA